MGCHAEEQAAWAGSHHALAHAPVGALERFDGAERDAGGLRATPLLLHGSPAFRVRDAAGTVTWPAVSAIGVTPLQQYVLDAGGGRRVVAPLAWDVERQQWFDPAPGGAVGDPADPLYWAGLAGTWNHLCAECHSTGFVKGYDPATATYTSIAAHPAVSCAACHGEATAPLPLADARAQLQACAPCHSRRRTSTCGAEPDDAFLDHYRPELIDSEAFQPDGRIRAPTEPFEWGPWSRSRMAAAGVRCSDCHDPHAGGLLRPGDATCTGCHPTVALPEHPASACVTCHMPESTYMGIHRRHDHGMVRPGAPGPGPVFTPALAGDPAAVPGLLALASDPAAPAFDRASALRLLRRFPPPADAARLRAEAGDADPLIRLEAVSTLAAWGDLETTRLALTDPTRTVRLAALQGWVEAGADVRGAGPAFRAVLAEFESLAACQDDLPSTWQNLGRPRAAVGDREGAIAAFQTQLRLSPGDPVARRALEALGAKP